jgi:hypothetical protein
MSVMSVRLFNTPPRLLVPCNLSSICHLAPTPKPTTLYALLHLLGKTPACLTDLYTVQTYTAFTHIYVLYVGDVRTSQETHVSTVLRG